MTLPSQTPPLDAVRLAFGERFGGQPRLFRAPGRINLIGEHTDYSEGYVLPAAIDRACIVAANRNGTDRLQVVTLNAPDGRTSSVELGPTFARRGDWTDYVAGVRASLARAGIQVPGCNLVLASDVPEGAGVSSSAALEVSVMIALLTMAERQATGLEVARWAQIAESEFVGMPCGIMDQFASVHGQADHALRLDCRTLAFEPARIPADATFLVVDSGVRHQLTDGGYAARRADCEAAAAQMGVPVLRDANPGMLAAAALPERLHRRALHVIEETERVTLAAKALALGRLAEVGRLMSASHASLRDLFNVTCPETDALASMARATPGVHGARQMGGGFGGAVLALVDTIMAKDALETLVQAYGRATQRTTSGFICRIESGAREIFP
jgi:galactokinase